MLLWRGVLQTEEEIAAAEAAAKAEAEAAEAAAAKAKAPAGLFGGFFTPKPAGPVSSSTGVHRVCGTRGNGFIYST